MIWRELEAVPVDTATPSESDARVVHSTLDCEGSGSNRYTVKAAFREMVAESILQVELDVRKHSLTILPRQGLCLGRMFESRLTVITDLPENWLALICARTYRTISRIRWSPSPLVLDITSRFLYDS